jgi:SAM-dependent methyltransferase
VSGDLAAADLARLRCPRCRGPVSAGAGPGALACGCRSWPARGGFASLLDEAEIAGNDALLRPLYDRFARLHDPAVRYTLPLFGSGTEGSFREGYLPLVEAASMAPGERLLDVGIGSGADLPLLARAAPAGVEVWGVDLAPGMLRLGRDRARALGMAVRMLLADAHALPFPDASFDRVLHVGATNSFRDPRRAVAEMARVAKPGAPIVIVDERLDPHHPQSLVHRLIFRAICFYEPHPPEPTSLLPEGAYDVVDRQIARFLYAVRFRRR